MTALAELKYRAFLSYAQVDMRWANWLHVKLERYHLDDDLAGRVTPMGPVPKSLAPIFRDREDFAGGRALEDATVAALDQSAALIVICSRTAAERTAVNEEVRVFRARHPDRPSIPVIVDGTFPDNFPRALRFELANDASVSDRPITILGPDLRDTGDGKALGLAKLVAALIGVDTDEIVRRAARESRRRTRRWIVGLSAVALSLGILAAWAVFNRQQAVRNFGIAKATADKLVVEIVHGLRNVEGLRKDSALKILDAARDAFDELSRAAPNSLELQSSRSTMFEKFGDTYQAIGDLPKALQSFEAARKVREQLANAAPSDVERQQALWVAHGKIGDVLAKTNPAAAREHWRGAYEIAKALADAHPADSELQRDLSVVHFKIGSLLRQDGDLPGAMEHFDAALRIRKERVDAIPRDIERQIDLGIAHERIGDALLENGKSDAALEHFRTRRDIVAAVAERNPSDTRFQRDLEVAHTKVGDVLIAKGDAAGALADWRAARRIASHLAASDPGNVSWQGDLFVIEYKIGDALADNRDLPGSLASYRASLTIAEHLSDTDKTNLRWLGDLAVALDRVGWAAGVNNDRAAAVAAYRRGKEVAEQLVRLDPNRTEFKHQLQSFEAALAKLN